MDYIKTLYKHKSIVEAMMNCSHHNENGHLNPYHLEGDVWTHTCLTYKVAQDYGFPKLSQIIALLHDIGKPSVRHVDENGKVWFTGHEAFSMFRAIDIIQDFDLDVYDEMFVLFTIGRHQDLYPYLKDGKMKESKIISRFQNRNLYNLVVTQTFCDYSGRIFEGDRVGVFQRIQNLMKLADRIEPHYRDRKKDVEVVLLVGPPLCGKSTFVKEYYPDYECLCRDDIVMELAPKGMDYTQAFQHVDQAKVDEIFDERIRRAVSEEKNIVVDKTHISKRARNKTLSLINGKYHKKAIVFLTGYETLLERNRKRFYETGKFIPEEVINRFISSFSFPYYDTFHEIDYYYNDELFQEESYNVC